MNLRPDVDLLYRQETHQHFAWAPVPAGTDVRRVLEQFRLPLGSETIEQVQKRNLASSLYRAEIGGRRVILRSCSELLREITEAQCRLLDAVGCDRILKPLSLPEGGHTVRTEGLVWMAYEELRGDLFPGSTGTAEGAVAGAVALQAALTALRGDPAFGGDVMRLPRISHRRDRWKSFLSELSFEDLPPSTVSPGTRALLERNRDFLVDAADRAAALPTEQDIDLTHNDLQHANVLVDEQGYFFLDIEDLCRESRSVALAHAAFKLSRHMVFSGAATRARARGEIAPAVAAAAGRTAAELVAYGTFRIVSDLFEIVAWARERQDPSQLYDLEKRFHNLFELHDLFGDDDGPAAKG